MSRPADFVALPVDETLARLGEHAGVGSALSDLLNGELYTLPRTGQGRTLERWRVLFAVARQDLSLVKLYEGHVDALSILSELGAGDLAVGRMLWGVWAAETPDDRVIIDASPLGAPVVSGRKRWCSGAEMTDAGLLTAWWRDGRGPQLVAVRMRDSRVGVDSSSWRAVGMAASASADVTFDGAAADLVGDVGDYLRRPGFWQGGAGIASCWLGGATGLADALRQRGLASGARPSPHLIAALGRVDAALNAALASCRATAVWIDEHPGADAIVPALRVRLAVEAVCGQVMYEVGRALGATPYARDARFARLAADLPVFLRQSHADQDAAALAAALDADGESAWTL